MKDAMKDILALVRAGRLTEATGAIQGRPVPDLSAPAGPGPSMKDVTPPTPSLPGATTPIRPRPTSRQPRPMERRQCAVPYRLFVPSTPAAGAPLLVMLHGCTQTPEDFAAGTRVNARAEEIGANVIWPEQTRLANPNGCWNWFLPDHQGRTGEAAAIASVIEEVRSALPVPPSGVFVAGLSAGGAMAAILSARYPDLVDAVAIHSGLPVGSARDVPSAFAAMRSGGPASVPLGTPAIVFQGSADRTVAPANALALAGGALPGGKPRRRTVTAGGRQAVVTRTDTMELWEIDGLGHAWSGGDTAGSYADPIGPDATAEMLRYFAEFRPRT